MSILLIISELFGFLIIYLSDYHFHKGKKMRTRYKFSGFFIVFLMLIAIYLPHNAIAQQKTDSSDLSDASAYSSEMRFILEQYSEDRSSLSRSYNIPMSGLRFNKIKQFLLSRQKEMKKLNFNSMGRGGKIDYLMYDNLLKYELKKIVIEKERNRDITKLLPFLKTITGFEEARRKMESVNPEDAADGLNRLHDQISNIQDAVKAGLKKDPGPDAVKVKRTLANRASRMARRLKYTLKRWFDFYNGYDPLFTWWAAEPYKKADTALDSYADFLQKKVAGVLEENNKGPIIGDPVGRESLMSDLEYAMIPYTPEELIEIGRKEYDWCEAELIKASRELGYGENWLEALEYVKTLHVKPGEQPAMIRDQALEAIDFLEKNDMLTIPDLARDTWRIEMMSPRRQKVNPFFTGGEVISVSFPTNTMEHDQKLMSMRGNNRHFCRAVVHHELIPGHHLQMYMMPRYRAYRGIFRTPFWLEGWALHWEMLLWDMNFAKSPEDRIGMLFWRIHRCARIVFSLSFHLEKMTAQECIDMLVNRVGHELDNATGEVRRSFAGGYPPLYQCAYLLGGLQIRALHKELVGSKKMTNREFHDRIMTENSIPIEMLRAGMTNVKLTKDFKPSWKFYK